MKTPNPYAPMQEAVIASVGGTNAIVPLLFEWVLRAIKKARIRLSKVERGAVKAACERIAAGESIEILRELPIKRRRNFTIDLTPDKELDALVNRRLEATRSAVASAAQKLSKDTFGSYRDWANRAAERNEEGLAQFRIRLLKKWKVPFKKLAAFTTACSFHAQQFMEEVALVDGEGKKLPAKLAGLFLLHARACIVIGEIQQLLRSGFADGAMARWRTLHEIAVITEFIASAKEIVAQSYLDYQDIEGYRAAFLYKQYQDRLGMESIDDDIEALQRRRDQLVRRYGPVFEEEYGWAAASFGGKPPRFSAIEKYVCLDHLRPYYKMASQQTHATSKGAAFRLGLLDDTRQGRDIMLAGPTNTGFTDPAQLASLSMLQITTCLLERRATLDRMVAMSHLTKMQDKIASQFWRVEQRIRDASTSAKPGVRADAAQMTGTPRRVDGSKTK